jgi:hypothetical protein
MGNGGTHSPVQYTRRNPLRFRSARPFSQDQEHHATLREAVENLFRDAQVSKQPLQHRAPAIHARLADTLRREFSVQPDRHGDAGRAGTKLVFLRRFDRNFRLSFSAAA